LGLDGDNNGQEVGEKPSLPLKKDDECDFCSHQCEIGNSALLHPRKPPERNNRQKGGTLFGLLMTSDLAVFQNIISD
jgi:hypothetical protein